MPTEEKELFSPTTQELQLILELLMKASFPSAEAKLLAGNLQAKVESELSKVVTDG